MGVPGFIVVLDKDISYPLDFQCGYLCSNERSGDGKDRNTISRVGEGGFWRGKSENCLVSCMQMTWFCVLNWKRN